MTIFMRIGFLSALLSLVNMYLCFAALIRVSRMRDRRDCKSSPSICFAVYPQLLVQLDTNQVYGLAQIDKKLFVVSRLPSSIDVFVDRYPFQRLGGIAIEQLTDPQDLVACEVTMQLFVGGQLSGAIWRIDLGSDLQGTVDKFVQHEYGVQSMSVRDHRLLLTSHEGTCLHVYDVVSGAHLSVFRLPSNMIAWHALETDQQTFYVCHTTKQSRNSAVQFLSHVDSDGHVIRAYGDWDVFRRPVHAAFDAARRLMVADRKNGSVVLMNEQLNFDHVLLKSDGDVRPNRLTFSRETRQLCVGLNSSSVRVYYWNWGPSAFRNH